MLEARIIAPRGSLYFAGDATPYDLETLRQHLRECQRGPTSDVTLELTVEDGPGAAMVTAWLGSVTNAGYRVRIQHPEPATP